MSYEKSVIGSSFSEAAICSTVPVIANASAQCHFTSRRRSRSKKTTTSASAVSTSPNVATAPAARFFERSVAYSCRHASGTSSQSDERPTASPCTSTRYRIAAPFQRSDFDSHTNVRSTRAGRFSSVASTNFSAAGSSPRCVRSVSSAIARARSGPASAAAAFSGRIRRNDSSSPSGETNARSSPFSSGFTNRNDHRQTGTSRPSSGTAFVSPSSRSRKTFASSSWSKTPSAFRPATSNPRAASPRSATRRASSRVTRKSIEASGNARENSVAPIAVPRAITATHTATSRRSPRVNRSTPEWGLVCILHSTQKGGGVWSTLYTSGGVWSTFRLRRRRTLLFDRTSESRIFKARV